jgi:hypothetical protein
MLNLYQDIKIGLEKINFNNLWPGFRPCRFALYDNKSVY